MSDGATAWVTPESPPIVNCTTSPMANSIAVVKTSLPPHMVSVQLMILTPVGTAMAIVARANTDTLTGPSPEANMWWAHTPQPTKPMAAPEKTTNGYPNSGLREKTGSTSLTIPNDGRIRMYTSGCPKIQNRCCHSSGSAPALTEKNVASNWRWNSSSTSATVITGMANTSRNWITRTIHVNTGMRISDMPLVRMLSAVTMRLIAPVCEARPVMIRPTAHRSMPLVGENGTLEFGAYMNHPPSAAPPRIHDVLMNSAPKMNAQMPNALMRGKATSRAPTCSGRK